MFNKFLIKSQILFLLFKRKLRIVLYFQKAWKNSKKKENKEKRYLVNLIIKEPILRQ